ncbi:MAG: hypothetical protein ACFFDN_26010 [Candidatus Hodarchaeota archaeon]
MAFLQKLEDWPSPDKIRLMTIFGLIITILAYIFMGMFFMEANYSMNFFASQLSFNGFSMKLEYFPMVISNRIGAYRFGQIFDYLFMVGYGTLIFSLALIIGRKSESVSIWRKSSYIIAILGIAAAILDGIENAFILLTLTNPLGFPDWWTVAHSCFAFIKYICLFSSIVWAILAVIKIKI